MQEQQSYIPAGEICERYNVELTFISHLEEFGLVETSTLNDQPMIAAERLQDLEKFIHLHYDLNINMEGIDAIQHLLQRLKLMREQVESLKNKLRIYDI